jgi:hypothetical protein
LIDDVDVGGDVVLPDCVDVVIVAGDIEHVECAAIAGKGLAEVRIERGRTGGKQAVDGLDS